MSDIPATRHFYFVRHGEAQGGPSGMDRDFELTARGQRQAHALGRRLRRADIEFRTIFHSALTRARQTAGILSEHVAAPLQQRLDLIEHGSEVYLKDCSLAQAALCCPQQLERDGKLRQLRGEEDCLRWEFSVGGEDMRALHARARAAWAALLELAPDDGNYLVVSHGSFLSALLTEILELPFRPFWNFGFENCACLRLQLRAHGARLYPIACFPSPLPAPKNAIRSGFGKP